MREREGFLIVLFVFQENRHRSGLFNEIVAGEGGDRRVEAGTEVGHADR